MTETAVCKNCSEDITWHDTPAYSAWLHEDGFYGCWQGDAKVSKAEPDDGGEK